jgi:hypothetical protein
MYNNSHQGFYEWATCCTGYYNDSYGSIVDQMKGEGGETILHGAIQS